MISANLFAFRSARRRATFWAGVSVGAVEEGLGLRLLCLGIREGYEGLLERWKGCEGADELLEEGKVEDEEGEGTATGLKEAWGLVAVKRVASMAERDMSSQGKEGGRERLRGRCSGVVDSMTSTC